MHFLELKSFNEVYEKVLLPEDLSKPAIYFNDIAISYGELHKGVEETMAHLVVMGVTKGSKVGYTLPNRYECIYLYLAIGRLGACAIPLYHMIPDQGKLGILANCEARFLITSAEQFDGVSRTASQMNYPIAIGTIDAFEKASYSFDKEVFTDGIGEKCVNGEEAKNLPLMMASSSGTTGAPKYVEMTQKNVLSVLRNAYELMYNGEEDYSIMFAFPFSTSGIMICASTLLFHGTIALSDDMAPPKFLQMVDRWKVDAIAAPPSYLEAAAYMPGFDALDFSSVRGVYTGMDFFPNKLLHGLRRRFSNLNHAGNGYGLIETTTVVLLWKANSVDQFDTPTNVMKPVDGVENEFAVRASDGSEIAQGETGELFIKGPNMVAEYFKNPAETEKAFTDGWFRTGDVSVMEEDGSIKLLGRNKDIIKRGGRSIAPHVISDHINKLPTVVASAVVGVPHPLYGEMIWAYIVTPPGVEMKEGDIMKHAREGLPSYMIPDATRFIDAIPKNPGVGKVNFEALKEMSLKELAEIEGEV